ncbi:translation machinery-associated protein 20 [Ophidiomyces ophidiicola]|uniref:Translation machinery-associated protein 20 n=1 Tax=Ophidiomyces ophidiicola TaxID=1387563 RepID=A0ACB8UZ32_9EURO|nr:translation machinery-associated protein 20 [Ophidiomyces ophidiicola]KAI1913560.1 translation machinery-associated protein 20 [Ophidiomyces ophidiicola]KAI1917280.1 translation machinery-associated protein 20 [Ophidiomyces ophidiicola]KAI1930283.1 translation machinery-associated protein 20 [Ophidiomyces ophidiicola]KAI1944669.1 translation machinery-associated protein 20 [Ophidiomyces ophidiicola]KAI1953296.1 translation machinery-associated protein 20 [Ophidiomyces ophidiicola]
MFKKEISPGARSKVKSSVQRSLRSKFLETYPGFEPYIDEVMPKKASLEAVKLPDRVTLYLCDSNPIFFQSLDSPLIPHLRVLHAFPKALPTIGIDRGAIRFVLSGAALMAPGLTSAGGRLPDPAKNPGDNELEAGQVVAITAEGKEEICMVGQLTVGTEEMKKKAKGVVMDEGHFLGDGLWKLQFD